jgi:hypothetical protein
VHKSQQQQLVSAGKLTFYGRVLWNLYVKQVRDKNHEFIFKSFVAKKITLKMEAIRTSEMSVNFNVTIWRYIPEHSKLHSRRRKT